MNRNKLVGAIASAGLTNGKVAEKIGMSKNAFSAKLNGKSFFNTDEVERICSVIGIVDDAEKVDIFLTSPS